MISSWRGGGGREETYQLTPINYLNCLKYLKYCFDNAIYNPELGKKKQVIFWFIGTNGLFFLQCYFKIRAIEQGSPASYQVAYWQDEKQIQEDMIQSGTGLFLKQALHFHLCKVKTMH